MNTSSMMPLTSLGGHSAQVNMSLRVNGLSLQVAQMGPDFVLVNAPVNYPPAAAVLVMQVDQSERQWNVHLPNGISAGNRRVAIATGA